VVVKPGVGELDGVRCVPDLTALPGKVDLFVVALSAAQAPTFVAEVIERDLAEGLIVIPGGLEEKQGGAELAARMRAALADSRASDDGGPLINGGNCLGIRSRPGGYDTLFIPRWKLPAGSRPAPIALITGSGAFAVTRLSRLGRLDPRYVVTVGNQMDLTVGDHLEHLATDESIRVFGVYVEGFARLDGLALLRAARTIRARGGVVVLYRAGRTRAGAQASASHTAAIAGDAIVTATLARDAGVVVAETLDEFDDLLGAFVRLDGRTTAAAGRAAARSRVGAVTNAGFECVAIADTLDSLELAALDETTVARLEALLRERGIGNVVEVHNPFDLTPMADDATYVSVAEAILASPGVDVGLLGDVPFTVTLRTLPAEDLAGEGTVATGLVELWRRTSKAWLAVVDAGERYDPLARHLEHAGIPTFRTADRAMRVLNAVVSRSTR
jgi:acyl-CoA synthetase (NDP forming)